MLTTGIRDIQLDNSAPETKKADGGRPGIRRRWPTSGYEAADSADLEDPRENAKPANG